jgi:hypothetical protein
MVWSDYPPRMLNRDPFGYEIREVDAQKQARTKRDVKVRWVRPKVPSKINGRKGTRKGWKRKNAPHWELAYREPEDVLIIDQGPSNGFLRIGSGRPIIIVTPAQAQALREATRERREPVAPLFVNVIVDGKPRPFAARYEDEEESEFSLGARRWAADGSAIRREITDVVGNPRIRLCGRALPSCSRHQVGARSMSMRDGIKFPG